MKNIIIVLVFMVTGLMAELKNVWASADFAEKSGVKIIDIRTTPEWKETGIVKDSYTIMFFNENGEFDVKDFLSKLNKVVKKDEQFALICRTGSRTALVAEYLSTKLNYKVINLKGGINKMLQEGYKSSKY